MQQQIFHVGPLLCRSTLSELSARHVQRSFGFTCIPSLSGHHCLGHRFSPLLQKKVRNRPLRRDWTVLENPEVRRALSQSISANMTPLQVSDPDGFWNIACRSVEPAIHHFVPIQSSRANKPWPWIRAGTLHLLGQRRTAREHGDWMLEKQLRRQTKESAKTDRAKWLEDLAAAREWAAIKQLRKWRNAKQGRLRNLGENWCPPNTVQKHWQSTCRISNGKVRPTNLSGTPFGLMKMISHTMN